MSAVAAAMMRIYWPMNSSIAVVVVWDAFVFVTRSHMLQAFIPAVTVHWGSGYDPARQGHALELLQRHATSYIFMPNMCTNLLGSTASHSNSLRT